MSTINYLTVRNTVLPVVNAVNMNYSTLTGSTITATSLNLTSANVALGASTNQTYTNFSSGSYAPPWITAKEALSSTNKTVMSANGLYQMIVGNATSGLFLSSDSGITWTALTGGLPTLTGSAYWSDGAISANGQYITLSIYGGSLWMSADYGRTFALTNQPTPSIWLPLNGNTTDLMGSSTVTTPGTVPGYVTLNYPGYTAQAVNLLNTAGGTATRYVRGTWAGATNFTVSGWVNPQALNSTYQGIFSAYTGKVAVSISDINTLYATIPTGGGTNFTSLGFYTLTLSVNTWYYFTLIFQTNGLCSFYVNNNLIASATNVGGVGSFTTTQFSLGTYDSAIALSFNGYIDDLRITNSVSTYVPIPLLQPNIWLPFENTAGDLGSYSLPSSAIPLIYLPFEGNLTDSMIGTTVTPSSPTPPTYVAANREGYTGQALRLTNPAGGTAAQFIRGSWTGASNFTVSFWFNAQSIGAPSNQVIFVAYTGAYAVYINTSNQIMYYIPSGGTALNVVTGPVVSINTWYYITAIFQTNGVCSLYVNNSLAGSYTNSGGVGSYTTTAFAIATYDTSTPSAFNGTVDDLRIYNSAVPYVPISMVNVTGSLSYVPGIVGLNAVNIANTAGGTATNFIKGAWTGSPNFTVSFWFNSQSLSATVNQCIWYAYNSYVGILIDSTNRIIFYSPNGSSANVIVATSSPISLNTWYHVHAVFQSNGVCSLHVNGTLIGTYTNVGGIGSLTTTQFGVGVVDNSTSYAFNGYIDDFRIYNAAIPYHVLFPQNYRSLALSGTGQYALASAASGWVVGSSNSSQTWSKQTVNGGTQIDLIQPQLTGLAATTWTQNGVNWTASSSSNYGAPYISYNAFNNTSILADGWAASATNYNTSGVYTGSATTTVIGITGSVPGDWLQIQSNVPLVMYSYLIHALNINGIPKTIVIVGSNDGTTWYALQSASYGTNPYTAQFQTTSGILLVNYSGSQTITGNGSSVTVTTTPYSYSTTAYQYFRLIYTSNFSSTGSSYAQTTEWLINFARTPTQALSLNHTGQYQLIATGPAAGSIMPNQTGLAPGASPTVSTSWIQSGVSWTASASSNNGSTQSAHKVFNNIPGDAWLSDNVTQRYTAAGVTNGNTSTTSVIGVGTVTGEWIQIQSSIPLVLSSFGLGIGLNTWPNPNAPKTYYIIGSNDGSTWYPLQNGDFTISNFVGSTNPIIINTTGTQTLSGMTGSVATTSYSTSTQAYMFYRMIGTSIMRYGGQTSSYMEIGELYLNFQNSVSYSSNYGSTWLNTRSTVSNESVALSPSGQYVLSTNSVAPLVRLTLDNTNVDAQGVLAAPTVVGTSFSYSTSTKVVGTHSINFANTAGASSGMTYLNYTVPAVLNKPSMLTMSCWIYPTALPSTNNQSIAMSFNNNSNVDGAMLGIVPTGKVLLNYYTTTSIANGVQSLAAINLNTWTHLAMTFGSGSVILYVNGISQVTTAVTGSLSLNGGGNITNLFVGTQDTTYAGAFAGNVDDVRLYTSALNADEVNGIFRNPALTQTIAVSNSYLPITSYTEPVLPGITANVVDTAVSQTGQYMVAVTSSTTNNMYYSTDFGATFTALTIGSSAMVSCSISYDGTYLTVTNATTTYTLNRNTRGFALAIGNQAGRINQGLNAIAIGDKAGQTNQSNNSIVLNATGTALDAVAPGFYVAPIATTTSSSATSFGLLGYGTDNQVTQMNLTVLSNGNVGINATNPMYKTQIILGSNSDPGTSNVFALTTADSGAVSQRLYMGLVDNGGTGTNSYSWMSASRYGHAYNSLSLQPVGGNVGIGITNPVYPLAVQGHIQALNTTNDVMGLFSPSYGNFIHIGAWNAQGSISKNIVMNYLGGNVGIGMSTPNAPLHVIGVATSGLSGNPPMSLINSSYPSVRWDIGPNTNGDLVIFYNNNGAWLGRGNPGAGWNLQSDLRLKDEIEPIENCLDKITALRPVSYRWKYNMDSPYKSFGLIAQEAKDVIPEMVNALQDSTHGEIYGITYTTCIPILIGAVKELSSTVVELQAVNATTSSQMATLQEENAQLKSQMSSLLSWAQTQGFTL
jgi:hypothetical protein